MQDTYTINSNRFHDELNSHKGVKIDKIIKGRKNIERRACLGVQYDVGCLLGVSEPYMSQIANGRKPVPYALIFAMANLFGCSIEWLTGESDYRTTQEENDAFDIFSDKNFRVIQSYLHMLGYDISISPHDNDKVILTDYNKAKKESLPSGDLYSKCDMMDYLLFMIDSSKRFLDTISGVYSS